MDLYPVKAKNYNPFNGWKWLSIALVVVAIILLYKTCNPPHLPVLPAVVPVADQKEKVRVDSVASQKYKDSISEVIKGEAKKADAWYSEWKASEQRYNDLENGAIDLLDKPVPDTCNALKAQYLTQIKALSVAANKNKLACEGTIKAKDAVIAGKDGLLAKSKEDYTKLKLNFDTALIQQQKLTKAVHTLRSRSEIYAGIMAMGSEIKPFEGAGVSIGLRNKKGTQYEIFALQFNSGVHYGLSYKTRLFKL